jgi:acetone monooxygenase
MGYTNGERSAVQTCDAIVVGAGILRPVPALVACAKLGLKVTRVLESRDLTWAAPGTGTAIPARASDSPSHIYQYWFSDDLLDEWKWN